MLTTMSAAAARSPWTFSQHARRRAAERGISVTDMIEVMSDPEVTYTQSTHGCDRQVRQRGELGLVVNATSRTVITVLFRDHGQWVRQLAAAVVA